MIENLLNEVGVELEKWVKDRIRNKQFNRFNKIGGTIPPTPRKIYGSGNLERSVNVVIEDDEILISMNDYGADILFGEGRRAGAKPPPYRPILEWVKTIPTFAGLTIREMTGISIAIAKNIGKRGYSALDLFTEENFENETLEFFEEVVERILQKEEYQDLGLDIDEVIDKIVLLSNNSLEIIYD